MNNAEKIKASIRRHDCGQKVIVVIVDIKSFDGGSAGWFCRGCGRQWFLSLQEARTPAGNVIVKKFGDPFLL